MIQQTKLYADFIDNLRVDKNINTNRFLYIVTPADTDFSGAGEDFEGGYNRIISTLKDQELRSSLKSKKTYREHRQEYKYLKDSMTAVMENQRRMIGMMNMQYEKEGKFYF